MVLWALLIALFFSLWGPTGPPWGPPTGPPTGEGRLLLVALTLRAADQRALGLAPGWLGLGLGSASLRLSA